MSRMLGFVAVVAGLTLTSSERVHGQTCHAVTEEIEKQVDPQRDLGIEFAGCALRPDCLTTQNCAKARSALAAIEELRSYYDATKGVCDGAEAVMNEIAVNMADPAIFEAIVKECR